MWTSHSLLRNTEKPCRDSEDIVAHALFWLFLSLKVLLGAELDQSAGPVFRSLFACVPVGVRRSGSMVERAGEF